MTTKTIVAQLTGGLGNQLFIYAAARAFALQLKADLALDPATGFRWDLQYKRKFLLDHFSIGARYLQTAPALIRLWSTLEKKVSSQEWIGARLHRFYDTARWINSARQPRSLRATLYEGQSELDPRLQTSDSPPVVVVNGMWQSERYFSMVADTIRNDLQLRAPVSQETAQVHERLTSCETPICIHVRRYEEAPTKTWYGKKVKAPPLAGFEYYQEAIKKVQEHCSNPTFFCFGDHSKWLQQQMGSRVQLHSIDHNASKGDAFAHEDLWLMSQCKHFVIANSTFSWWAAWLCNYQQKQVHTPPLSRHGQDFIPKKWIIVRPPPSQAH